MQAYLEFEKQIADLEGKIRELQTMGADGEAVNLDDDIGRLKVKSEQALADIYTKLNPWQKTQVARHPDRPHFKDYATALFEDLKHLPATAGLQTIMLFKPAFADLKAVRSLSLVMKKAMIQSPA